MTERDIAAEIRVAWELILDEGEERLELGELLSLVGIDDCVGGREAVVEALGASGGFFKRKGEFWAPVSRKVVEERERQTRREAEKALAAAAVLEELSGHLAGNLTVDALSPEARAALAAIRRCAVENDANQTAKRFLGELYPGDRRPYPLVAFGMMVTLGNFEEHEDLNLLRLGARPEFEAGLEEEAVRVAARVQDLGGGREVLSHLLTVAIDDCETVEVDDALALEERSSGYRLHVFITDVAAAIDRDSAIDMEAAARATTIYHPGTRICMLPELLSAGVLSLDEGAERLVLDHYFDLDSEFRCSDAGVKRAVASVDKRLTYEEADVLLESGSGDLGALLAKSRQACRRMFDERVAQGAIHFYPEEVKLRVRGGIVERTVIDTFSPARRLVAEFMVAAGGAAGRYLADRGIPAIFRCQVPPVEPLEWSEEASRDPVFVLDSVRKLKRAEISLKPGRHAALGLEAYCQVTSPLRRYGDLLIQRQLHSVLSTGVACYGEGELLARMSVADETSLEVRRLVRSAERYWALVALRESVGREVDAVVLMMRRKQAVVLLREYGVQGKFFPQSETTPGTRLPLKVVHVEPRTDTVVLASPDS